MAMPFLTGLINIVVPQQIGTRDVAFPFLNSLSLWLTAAGAGLVLISLVIGKFSTAGWTAYPPYSGIKSSPGVGVDYWLWAVLISGIGSTLTGINFIVTILKRRAPGMTLMRMPVFTWTALTASVLIAFAFPALTVIGIMLGLDRYLDMHFFTSDAGGNMMLYVNLIWIWGHPEVYILILRAFGIFSEIVAVFSGKRVFGYHSLVGATLVIALLSFTVWLHHFFTMGASSDVNAFFGIATMIIAVPTGVKVFNWLFTMYGGRVRYHTCMLWTMGFIVTFVLGGVTGVLLAIPPIDYIMHNTVFLVAHFHNMLIPGMLFGLFAGLQYWFPKAFGFRLDQRWGNRAFWCWISGFLLAFMPLYALGLMGMPRRMENYEVAVWQPFLIVAALGACLVAAGIGCMVMQFYVSIRRRESLQDHSGDPWNGRTLEWLTPSPPPPYNFALIPEVRERDAFWEMKLRGEAYHDSERYEDITMPKSTMDGVALGMLAFVFGFAMVWHIWWLVGVSLLLGLGFLIRRTWNDEDEYVIDASEVAALEADRHGRLATVPGHDMSAVKSALGQPVSEVTP